MARLRIGVARRLPARARHAINVARGIDQPLVVDRLPGQRVVVLAPHPDDEVIGCGGAIAGHVRAGCAVRVIHVTSGERTWSAAPGSADDKRERREAQAARAAAELGIGADGLRFLRTPDGQVGATDDVLSKLQPAITEAAPDLVYAPWPLDAHRDHRGLLEALLAVHRTSGSPEWTIALYEVWGPLVASHLVDITAHIDIKIAALRCYEDATAGIDYVRTTMGLAAYRSGQGMSGRGYAEAFCVVPAARLHELV
jgi:LmbE family N-acetylglucosaminyl deacetylase